MGRGKSPEYLRKMASMAGRRSAEIRMEYLYDKYREMLTKVGFIKMIQRVRLDGYRAGYQRAKKTMERRKKLTMIAPGRFL